MNLFSRLLLGIRRLFFNKLSSFIDDRIKCYGIMTQSDYLEQHFTRLAQYCTENGISDEEYIPSRKLIVSLTSHGIRTLDAYLAIETIMQGTIKPNCIILWLPEDKIVTSCFLENQVKRGLEIKYVKDLGPHTKLIPALHHYPEDIIITIDDDIFYKPDMIEQMLRSYKKDPSSILANRVATMTKDKKGRLESYLKWEQDNPSCNPFSRNVIIGVEGCLYPPHCLSEEVFNETVFREICPTADDIWFTAMALLKGTQIKHLECRYENGFAGGVVNHRMQSSGLIHLNEDPLECRNDAQIRSVFDRYNLYPLIG